MTAEKFYKQAEALQKTIDGKLTDRLDNTPKRQKQAASARIEGRHLERVQHALNTLGNAAASNQLPAEYAKLKKSDLLPVFSKVYGSHGYYSVFETDEWSRKDEFSTKFRAWVDSYKSVEQEEKERDQKRLTEIKEIEDKLLFSNIPGYFPTPPAIARTMVEQLQLNLDGLRVLEPSAGSGSLLDAIGSFKMYWNLVTAIEVNYTLASLLEKKFPAVTVIAGDFMVQPVPVVGYERIIMNPPFENGQDMDHIRRAFDFLKSGGRLVSICSPGPFFRQDKKAIAFREWFESVTGEQIDLPEGAFKASGTGVKTILLIIDKD